MIDIDMIDVIDNNRKDLKNLKDALETLEYTYEHMCDSMCGYFRGASKDTRKPLKNSFDEFEYRYISLKFTQISKIFSILRDIFVERIMELQTLDMEYRKDLNNGK